MADTLRIVEQKHVNLNLKEDYSNYKNNYEMMIRVRD